MRIRWHGHACFEVRDDVTLVTDPHDGRSIGISPPRVKADVVLVSHDHFDHNSVRSVGGANIKVIKGAVQTTFRDVAIKGFGSYHDEEGGARRGSNTLFRFIMDDIKFLHLGDLGEQIDENMINSIGAVDVMFIPVGGVFTIDSQGAWEIAKRIQPKVIVPMHYRVRGLSLSLDTVDKFLENTKNIVRVGNEIDFQKEDLPAEMEVWVFTL